MNSTTHVFVTFILEKYHNMEEQHCRILSNIHDGVSVKGLCCYDMGNDKNLIQFYGSINWIVR